MGKRDGSGRRRPVPIEGSEFIVPIDQVIVAIGQQADLKSIDDDYPVDRTSNHFIAVDPKTGVTSHKGIFAGGDVATGPATVIEAIAGGKKAAYGIDMYLRDDKTGVAPMEFLSADTVHTDSPQLPDDFPRAQRKKPRYIAPSKRMTGFREVNKGYSESTALKEADRCLQCGTCANCNHCMDHFGCPAFYLEDGKVAINPNLCTGCGICAEICPNGAIYLKESLAD
jgi:heterodisulfide reductase subunit A-like polyferredoxin